MKLWVLNTFCNNIIIIKNTNSDLSLKDIFTMKLDNVRFQTEKTFFTENNKKRSIDVYGESDELVIIIENKVKARENMNGTDVGQTKDYRDYIQRHKKDGQKIICLFITPDPKQKSFDQNYTQITYQELYTFRNMISEPEPFRPDSEASQYMNP